MNRLLVGSSFSQTTEVLFRPANENQQNLHRKIELQFLVFHIDFYIDSVSTTSIDFTKSCKINGSSAN